MWEMEASRICGHMPIGTGVTTTRGDVHWIVTEYGAVDLWGKTVRERAKLLISISAPEFREELEKFAMEHKYI